MAQVATSDEASAGSPSACRSRSSTPTSISGTRRATTTRGSTTSRRSPFRYGDYARIRRRYLPPDYLADAAPFRVDKSVYVETEWDPRDPVGEMRYIDALRRDTGLPSVAVAQAWLDRDDAPHVLERHAALTVRAQRAPQAAREPVARPTPRPAARPTPRGAPAMRALARYGLRFDLQTPWWHLHEAARLAADFPDTPIILNHTGLPADRSRRRHRGLEARDGRARRVPERRGEDLRHRPARRSRGRSRPIATSCARRSTSSASTRCMFASNFPVDSLCATFATIFGGFRDIVADFVRRRAARAVPRQRDPHLRDAMTMDKPPHRLRRRRPDGPADGHAPGVARLPGARLRHRRRAERRGARGGRGGGRVAGRCGARRRLRAAQPADDRRRRAGGVRRPTASPARSRRRSSSSTSRP